jgi:thiol-disulfide isomerase/thioredoxin
MKSNIIMAVFCILFVGVFAGATHKKPSKRNYGILGKAAPELNLSTWIDGSGRKMAPVKLSELKGKVVFLYFFQDWCPGCQKMGFPTLHKLSTKLKSNDDIKFFAIQTVFEGSWFNTQDKLRENQKEHNISVPFAHDDGGEDSSRSILMSKYRTGGTPWTVIINKEGKVVYNDYHVNPDKALGYLSALSNVK